MTKDAFIRARTNADLKARVETIFTRVGLNLTDAINLFFHQVELHNGLPFEVKIPNSETLQALADLDIDHRTTVSTLDEFKASHDF